MRICLLNGSTSRGAGISATVRGLFVIAVIVTVAAVPALAAYTLVAEFLRRF